MKILPKLKKWQILSIAMAAGWLFSRPALAQQIRVVTTFPDLADITRQIGKNRVSVESLATGVEDPHGVPLLEVASNPKILLGQPGYIDCSVGIPVLEAPSRLDRAEGDLHPKGNPHYLLDPMYGKIAAQNIAAGLIRNFPQHQTEFDKNLKAYLAELDTWVGRWEKMAAPLRGVKYVEYHPEWVYFANRFGLKRVGSVELKPGIEPTPNHLVQLVQQIKQEKAQVLIYGAQNPRIPQQLQGETGIKVLRLYTSAGGRAETDTYIKWIDYTVRSLVQAVS